MGRSGQRLRPGSLSQMLGLLGLSFDLMGSGQWAGVCFRTAGLGSGAQRDGSAVTRGGEAGEQRGFTHAGPWGGSQETHGK